MRIAWDALPGNTSAKASLRAALNSRLPQTVLLAAPDEEDAFTCAGILSAALLCTGGGAPCGRCPSCRKLTDDAHPDCIVIDEGEGEIKVETARRIRAQAAILPNDGDRKVFVIRRADRMNDSAQNALLKSLEEPPRYAFFILTTAQPGALLQTIRSRCTIYQLEPPDAPDVPDEALLAPAAAFLRALARGDEYGMLCAANGFVKLNKTGFQQAMALLETAFRDAMLASVARPLLPALADETRALAGAVTTDKLLALCDHAALLARRADVNTGAAIQCAALAAGAQTICHPPRPARRRP